MGEGLNDQSQPGDYPDTDQADYNQFKQFAFRVNLKFFTIFRAQPRAVRRYRNLP